MKTKQMFLSAHQDYGKVWYTLTEPEIGALKGHMAIGLIDLPMDEAEIIAKLEASAEELKEVKRAELLAQLAELDNQEVAA